jgi:hypothetical protein
MKTQLTNSPSDSVEAHFPWKIGVATCDITPPVGATMVGYSPRISERIDIPLRAECLYCAGKSGAWLIVGGDFIGLARHRSDTLRTQIASRTGVPFEAILIAATHTHSGPRTLGFENDSPNPIDNAYISTLMDKLVDLAARAKASANPGRFEIVRTEAREWMSNRRVKQADGTCINEWQDFEGKHTGYVDPMLTILTVVRPDRSTDLVIVNYGCHPVVLGPESRGISGDYVGYLKREIETRKIARTSMFLLAPCGDINPRVCITNSPELAKKTGVELAGVVQQTLRSADAGSESINAGAVSGATVDWNIVRTRDAMKQPESAKSRIGQTLCTCMTALSAGDLCFVGLPGEPFSAYRNLICAKSPFRHTLVVAMTQDYCGYFPTDQAQLEGGYETKMAPADVMESALVEHALKAISGVAGKV